MSAELGGMAEFVRGGPSVSNNAKVRVRSIIHRRTHIISLLNDTVEREARRRRVHRDRSYDESSLVYLTFCSFFFLIYPCSSIYMQPRTYLYRYRYLPVILSISRLDTHVATTEKNVSVSSHGFVYFVNKICFYANEIDK